MFFNYTKEEVESSIIKLNTPIDVSNFIIGIYSTFNIEEDKRDKKNCYLFNDSDFIDIYYKLGFKHIMKKFFPSGMVRSYRGLSLSVYESAEDISLIQDREIFIDNILAKDLERNYVSHSLNILKSAFSFSYRSNWYNRKHNTKLGILIIYEAPISAYKGWGGDGESGMTQEFEVYVDPRISNEYIKEIFVLGKEGLDLPLVSKSKLKEYSLDECYSVMSGLTFLHKKAAIHELDPILLKCIEVFRLNEKFKWYRLF